jgi:hypothetical protein
VSDEAGAIVKVVISATAVFEQSEIRPAFTSRKSWLTNRSLELTTLRRSASDGIHMSFFSMDMPAATTVAAALISVLGAIGSAVLAYIGKSALEKRKGELTTQIEAFKAGLADDLAARNARRDYEYDARKRLYAQVEPLLFQLFEAAETAFNAVASLARTQRDRNLPGWLTLGGNDYYIRSIIHRLFLPLANYRLIQRSMTLIDLTLDPSIRLRYALLKESYLIWTDDFGLAHLAPSLPYDPNVSDWARARAGNSATFWRQGLVIGNLDRLLDAMIVDDGPSRRPMNFGEWEAAITTKPEVRQVYEIVQDIFLKFEFGSRPVLSRLLISYACMMHTLMTVYNSTAENPNPDLEKIYSDFVAEKARSDMLRCWGATAPDVFDVVRPYVFRRFKQAKQGGYATF